MSVALNYDMYWYGISPEGRKPGGGDNIDKVLRDKILADVEFLQVLLEGYSTGQQVEICLSLIGPTMNLIRKKIHYAQGLNREPKYPNPDWVKKGSHFPFLEEAHEFFAQEITQDASFILAVWRFMRDSILPFMENPLRQEILDDKNINRDITFALQIIESGVDFS